MGVRSPRGLPILEGIHSEGWQSGAPIISLFGFARCLRIVQYKMILKRDLFPIQDDPEKDSKGTIGGVGILRLNALTEVQIGEFLRGSRAIGFEGQSRAKFMLSCRSLWSGRSISGRAKSSVGQSGHI
jgi:hypothetical protein